MVSDTEIKEIISKLKRARPGRILDDYHINNEGVMHALVFLYLEDKSVSAGAISRRLNVSTARVAVILRKMLEKEIITKETDPKDARRAVIEITPKGRSIVERHKQMFYEDMKEMVDSIGKERFDDFLEVLGEMHVFLEEKRKIRGENCNENNI